MTGSWTCLCMFLFLSFPFLKTPRTSIVLFFSSFLFIYQIRFNALVFIIGQLVDNRRFGTFRVIMEQYIDKYFSFSRLHGKLLDSLAYYLDHVTDTSLQKQVRACVKALHYLFKFAVRSKTLFEDLKASVLNNTFQDLDGAQQDARVLAEGLSLFFLIIFFNFFMFFRLMFENSFLSSSFFGGFPPLLVLVRPLVRFSTVFVWKCVFIVCVYRGWIPRTRVPFASEFVFVDATSRTSFDCCCTRYYSQAHRLHVWSSRRDVFSCRNWKLHQRIYCKCAGKSETHGFHFTCPFPLPHFMCCIFVFWLMFHILCLSWSLSLTHLYYWMQIFDEYSVP